MNLFRLSQNYVNSKELSQALENKWYLTDISKRAAEQSDQTHAQSAGYKAEKCGLHHPFIKPI